MAAPFLLRVPVQASDDPSRAGACKTASESDTATRSNAVTQRYTSRADASRQDPDVLPIVLAPAGATAGLALDQYGSPAAANSIIWQPVSILERRGLWKRLWYTPIYGTGSGELICYPIVISLSGLA